MTERIRTYAAYGLTLFNIGIWFKALPVLASLLK